MTKKVSIWLTDKTFKKLEKRSRKRGLSPHQLATVALCKWLGHDIGLDVELFAIDYEIRTRSQRLTNNPDTLTSKIAEQLKSGPLSTPLLKEKLGRPSADTVVHALLANNPNLFMRVSKPEHVKEKRKRGKQPVWWEYVGDDDAN